MGDQSSTIQRRSWLDDQGEGGSDSAFPWYVLAVRAAACLFGLWHIATNLFLNEPGLWQNAIHVGGFALLAALLNPFSRRFFNRPLAILVDLIFGLAILAAALWVAFAEHGLYARTLAKTGQAWQFTAIDWIAGFVVIFGAIELTRRLTGWIIPILVLFALGYILFLGELSPGIFRAASLPVNDVLFRSLYNDEGMFGIITTISSTNITLFMIFGGFLMVSGASDFVIEAAKIVARRMRGGAAFVAVIASALTGTITGSAVANTASTGVLTIPLMKANGFRSRFAAGVEASASTGGQLMPPVMGAGAFVMAASTGIAYAKIVAVSIIPALLYFLAVAFIVRIEAVKHKIKTEASMEIDRSKLTAGALNFILPLAVMTAMLINGFTPSYSASTAIAVLIVASWFTARPIGIRRAVRALTLGVGTATMTALLLAAVGLINNAVTTSGLANALALMIVQWSQGSLVIAIALIALASLIL
ncbi:MAG: TRAP transporter fused permease subunit, partial [Pseudomonadota bacterium]